MAAKNWQTTAPGLIPLIIGALNIIQALLHGMPVNPTDIGLVGAGIASVRAKDKGVTGVGATATRPSNQ